MKIQDIIIETTAGAVAGVAAPLGGGDPSASIYSANKKKRKGKKKSKMVKRPALGEQNG